MMVAGYISPVGSVGSNKKNSECFSLVSGTVWERPLPSPTGSHTRAQSKVHEPELPVDEINLTVSSPDFNPK